MAQQIAKELQTFAITSTRKVRLPQLATTKAITVERTDGSRVPVVLLDDGTLLGHQYSNGRSIPHICFEVEYAAAWIVKEVRKRTQRAEARKEH